MAQVNNLIVNGTSRLLGTAYGSKFVVNNGSSSQFMKADGSLDSNQYLTSSSLNGYVTQTSLSANSYVTNAVLSGKSYVTQTSLSANSYVTQTSLSTNSYVTQTSLTGNGYLKINGSLTTNAIIVANANSTTTSYVGKSSGVTISTEPPVLNYPYYTPSNSEIPTAAAINSSLKRYSTRIMGTLLVEKHLYGSSDTASPISVSAGTYILRTVAVGSTASFTVRYVKGSSSWEATTTNGIIMYECPIEIESAGTITISISGTRASDTSISIYLYNQVPSDDNVMQHFYNYGYVDGLVVDKVGPVAITNNYDDLYNKPTIPSLPISYNIVNSATTSKTNATSNVTSPYLNHIQYNGIGTGATTYSVVSSHQFVGQNWISVTYNATDKKIYISNSIPTTQSVIKTATFTNNMKYVPYKTDADDFNSTWLSTIGTAGTAVAVGTHSTTTSTAYVKTA